MARIPYVDPAHAAGKQKQLLDGVQASLGTVPNMVKAMAGSAVLEGYLGLSGALGAGRIPPAVAERIALAVAESNECSYCLSAHSYLAKHVARIDAAAIEQARQYHSDEPKARAVLTFAEAVLRTRGGVDAGDLDAARSAGLSDAELAEIVGHVAVNVLTNYFNRAFATDVDFPVVEPRAQAAA
jgi:AhpD family alkylhydroperoxidase